jgi:hypothetical protein
MAFRSRCCPLRTGTADAGAQRFLAFAGGLRTEQPAVGKAKGGHGRPASLLRAWWWQGGRVGAPAWGGCYRLRWELGSAQHSLARARSDQGGEEEQAASPPPRRVTPQWLSPERTAVTASAPTRVGANWLANSSGPLRPGSGVRTGPLMASLSILRGWMTPI